LSKTIVLHFGHFDHNPSGISRFLDFAPASFGFLANVVLLLVGGGVTAGSGCSPLIGCFLKELEAMVQRKKSFK
jgi:hypothetical protein